VKPKFTSVRGTQDLFGSDAVKYKYVVDVARRNTELYNFHEIITPIIEFSELFERGVGEGSDIVMKELYKFADKGGDLIALRPEFTAGVARSFVANGELNQNLPQKLFSFGPIFRYDRPQKGRYRQFSQINCEYIGCAEYFADVEVIQLAHKILTDLGLKNISLEINSLGSVGCKQRYEAAIKKYFAQYKDKLSADSKIRLEKNPLRILDSKDDDDKQLVARAPMIDEFYADEDKIFFNNILKLLDKFEIKYCVNTQLVRGLDYYTSTVFEFTTTDLGAQATVLGGGRYDEMMEEFGGDSTPAVGFGGGIERMMLLVNDNVVEQGKLFAVIPVSENENEFCYELSSKLRKQGKNVEFVYYGKFKKKMEKLNKLGADFAIVVGEEEVKTGSLKIKDLKTGTESPFKI